MPKQPAYDLVIQNGTIVHGSRSFRIHVCIKDGKIASIVDAKMMIPDTKEIYDAGHMYIFPGLIEPHVHFALDMGENRSADDFESGSKAAAFGGYTTFFDFTDVITGDADQLQNFIDKRKAQASHSCLNTQLHLTVANPQMSPVELVELAVRNKLRSIKVFTTYSDSGRMTNDGYIYDLLKAIRGTRVMLMVHAENDSIISYKRHEYESKGPVLPSHSIKIHNTFTEKEAVLRICQLAVDANSKVYIAHVSSGETIERVNECFGKQLNKQIFLESCPQYLYLNDAYLLGEKSHLYTVCPPLRSEGERKLLRKQLVEGLISTIGSDHCPFPSYVKERYKENYLEMPNGLPGVELSFPLLYNLMMLENDGITVEDLTNLFSTMPAKIFGYYPYKGTLFPGSDADLMIYDPNYAWKVNPEQLHMNTDYTPYDGLMLRGKVDSTICGGQFVVKGKEFVPETSIRGLE